LTWAQVDLNEGRIEFPKDTTKNGEERRIYVTSELRAVLEQQWSEHLTLFPACEFVFHRNGKLIRDFRGAWKQVCAEAGLPTDRIPHDFRRTAIRNMVWAGIPERVSVDMSGHKTRAVFDRYNITSDGDLKDAARKLGEAFVAQNNDKFNDNRASESNEQSLTH
jgi:integrase